MEVKTNVKTPATLKEFTRLLIGFVCALVILAVYQQISLVYAGVIERPFNKTIFLLILNHLGFASTASFLFMLLFRFLERRKPGLGFRATLLLFIAALGFETFLVEYFVQNYALLQVSELKVVMNRPFSGSTILRFGLLGTGMGFSFWLCYKSSSFLNPFIGRMFPFTIILFLLVLGTSVTEKRPINQNKSIEFVEDGVTRLLNFNTYEGVEYPLLKPHVRDVGFTKLFDTLPENPNFVVIVIDGLSPEFVSNGQYAGFMPFLDSIAKNSVYWSRFLANSSTKSDALTNILGSLPQGEQGFTAMEHMPNRNTLFSILKKNGYRTGFYYGGNTALNNLDNFLKEEQVDIVVDKSRFNDSYRLQEADRAGVTQGYPDGELYRKWGASYFVSNRPKFEVFLNLSTSKPYSFPNESFYLNEVASIVNRSNFSKKQKRFIGANQEMFAAFNYADRCLAKLFKLYSRTVEAKNTHFILTGSGKSYLPNQNAVQALHIPFMMIGPTITSGRQLEHLASHHDVAPSLLSLLQSKDGFTMPTSVAWMGKGLTVKNNQLHLSDAYDGIKAVIIDGCFVKGRRVKRLDEDLQFHDDSIPHRQQKIERLKRLRAMNKYVVAEDKIMPADLALFKTSKNTFTKAEMVWISSVFSGKNLDNAYSISRKLAHEGNYQKALLLSSYVLENAPDHIDALILQGRIHAWKRHYGRAISLLERAVDLHPFYHDGYDALLDVYFWSGNNSRAIQLQEKIRENDIETHELSKKVTRCLNQIKAINNEQNQYVDILFEDG